MTDVHSPLPWHLSHDYLENLVVCDPDGGIAAILTPAEEWPFRENGAYIVQACNEHPALKARLAEAERLLRELLAKLPDRRPETDVEEHVAVFAAAAREFLSDGP